MSLQTAKELHCDGCSDWFRLDYRNLTDQWKHLKKDGWTREGGRHYCPRCGLNGSWENHDKEQDEK